ncbi:MAG: O-antigen ligase family protein [Opitutales bacterium]
MLDHSSSAAPNRLTGRSHRRHRPGGALDKAVLLHLGVLTVVTAWAFGGQSPAARIWLHVWVSVGMALLFVALAVLENNVAGIRRRALLDLWPLLLFDLLALAGLFNPTLRVVLREKISYFMLVDPPHAWLPGCSRPDLAFHQLWLLNGIVISAYNAFLVLRSRRELRQLLVLVVVNAVGLAIFGTFQRLVAAPGLYYGLVKSPQSYFFSTFVYHNHWSAFTLLNTAVCLGLFFHTLRRSDHRDIWHSPVLAVAVAALLLAATVPLSASRSGTVLICLLAGGALVHLLVRLLRQRRSLHESIVLPAAGIALAGLLAAGAIAYLARDVIAQRARLTTEQVAHMRQEDRLNSRLVLYRDTWRMAMERPWFGWGLESYGDVFRIFNTQRAVESWFGQPYYRAAHSDWLQSVAENGVVGTGLILLLGLLPLRHSSWRRLSSTLPLYLLAGCGLVLLYAWVEFPFANPSVLIAFWTALYVASRYAILDREAQNDDPAV